MVRNVQYNGQTFICVTAPDVVDYVIQMGGTTRHETFTPEGDTVFCHSYTKNPDSFFYIAFCKTDATSATLKYTLQVGSGTPSTNTCNILTGSGTSGGGFWGNWSTHTTPEGYTIHDIGTAHNYVNTDPYTSSVNVSNAYYPTWGTDRYNLIDAYYNWTPEDDDPYAGVGDNDVEGGGGDFDDTSIDIDFPPTPTISVADAGFVSLLTPTLAQIQALSSYMWSTAFDETQIKKLFANPMDVFIGMSILPITIPSSNTKTISIAGINTGLAMNLADSQFVNVDFGTLTIKTGTGGSYLDYSPYTKASIFLPYIGWRDIDIDEIMNKTLHLRYCVDIVSGGCVAWLKCGGSVLYEWTGQCAINIPLTSIDFTSTASAAISAVGHLGSAIGGMISGGASGAMSGADFGPAGIVAGAIGGSIGSAINGVAGLAQDALSAKPTFPKSGSLGGPAGVMGHQQAYICLHRPAMAKPKYQSKYMGYPSFITRKVSDLVGTGFNAFSDVRLQGLGLLDTEIAELTALLKGGVYL